FISTSIPLFLSFISLEMFFYYTLAKKGHSVTLTVTNKYNYLVLL
ncbi:MAG: hypothetical protein JWN76_899, partial [Chitinophagaceae bacterium]|nr:hypothetical protein [Chitinophagaceae bacterium]